VNFAEVNGTALRYDLLGSGAATLVCPQRVAAAVVSSPAIGIASDGGPYCWPA
jgi:hypothetical protein